jgi:hypothetical protein
MTTKPDIRTAYTLKGVQDLIQALMSRHGISMYEMAKVCGMNSATLYFILNRKPKRGQRKVRPTTIKTIAKGLGYEVKFEGDEIVFSPGTPEREPRQQYAYPELMEMIDGVLRRYQRQKITKALQSKIVKMVELLVK